MTNQPSSASATLSEYIERARKVLQHEQRTNHQDQAIKPGGLETFVVRWADMMSDLYKRESLDVRPIYRFTEHLESYRRQDPMQRAASIRAALSVLNEIEGKDSSTSRSARQGQQAP